MNNWLNCNFIYIYIYKSIKFYARDSCQITGGTSDNPQDHRKSWPGTFIGCYCGANSMQHVGSTWKSEWAVLVRYISIHYPHGFLIPNRLTGARIWICGLWAFEHGKRRDWFFNFSLPPCSIQRWRNDQWSIVKLRPQWSFLLNNIATIHMRGNSSKVYSDTLC